MKCKCKLIFIFIIILCGISVNGNAQSWMRPFKYDYRGFKPIKPIEYTRGSIAAEFEICPNINGLYGSHTKLPENELGKAALDKPLPNLPGFDPSEYNFVGRQSNTDKNISTRASCHHNSCHVLSSPETIKQVVDAIEFLKYYDKHSTPLFGAWRIKEWRDNNQRGNSINSDYGDLFHDRIIKITPDLVIFDIGLRVIYYSKRHLDIWDRLSKLKWISPPELKWISDDRIAIVFHPFSDLWGTLYLERITEGTPYHVSNLQLSNLDQKPTDLSQQMKEDVMRRHKETNNESPSLQSYPNEFSAKQNGTNNIALSISAPINKLDLLKQFYENEVKKMPKLNRFGSEELKVNQTFIFYITIQDEYALAA